jgi:predicted MPP superfamily phosphohydrolase
MVFLMLLCQTCCRIIPFKKQSFRIPERMYFRSGFRSFLLISLLCSTLPCAFSLPDGQNVSYSFVHISDTQSLDTYYPDTYNLTFSYLDSLREPYNTTAIIITGDLVNTWDSQKEWDTYSRARNHTTIPVYTIAGNHDTDYGKNYRQYTLHTGEPEVNYVSSVEDFDFVGINYADKTLPADEFSRLHGILTNSSRSNAIIATHYYMDEDGALSPLGKDIDTFLIVKPSLVLMGHMHADFIRQMVVGGFPTVADMTNYQDGAPGGKTGWDYSAGTLYTVTSINGQVETITARVIHIYPTPSFEDEMTVFSKEPDAPSPADNAPMNKKPFSVYPVSSCSNGDLFCILNRMYRQCWTNIRQVFS